MNPKKALIYCIFLFLILSGCKKEELPLILTAKITSIDQTSAVCGGYVISQGSSKVIARGICWSARSDFDPIIEEDSVIIDNSSMSSFTTKLTGLELNTTYFVRAYATNSLGTGYGVTMSFTTDTVYLPKVTTSGVSSITKTSAYSGGEITSDGASRIIDRGLCWGRSLNPTLSDNYISAGPGSNAFNITITGLKPYTDYFVRAYATNSAGTGYGDSRLFTTSFEVNPDFTVDPYYPTVFNQLDSTTLSQKRIAFAGKNRYLKSSLNEFGFCNSGSLEAKSPPFVGNISRDQAIGIVKDFILKNPSETGIRNPDDINFYSTSQSTTGDGSLLWVFKISDQKVNNCEVSGTALIIHVLNGEVVWCTGNWFPDIYIPPKFNLNQEQANSLLAGKVVPYSDFSGDENYVTITLNNLNSSSFKLFIFPFTENNRIELRVTWQISVIHCILYVDVMTGEIICKYLNINF
jgi:hypothetical protein